jgi:hypothetical protein
VEEEPMMVETRNHSDMIEEMNSLREGLKTLKKIKEIYKMSEGISKEEKDINRESARILDFEIKRLRKRIKDIIMKLDVYEEMKKD